MVGGFLGLLPAGGVTWDYVQYPVGFAGLGHDVFYVEDTRLWPVYQAGNADGADCAANVAHLARVMEWFGMAERWAYRDEASGLCFGMSEAMVREVCRTADVFVNVSCSTWLRDEYRGIPVRVLIDSDPMFTQIQHAEQRGFTAGKTGMREMVAGHTHHFTFGEHIGAPDCRIPECGVEWKPTRQPVCLEHWPAAAPTAPPALFTTLMNWTAGRPLEYGNERWGQKDVEFRRFAGLPRRGHGVSLGVAVGQTGGAGEPFPADAARRIGWRVLDPDRSAGDWRMYRAFLRGSAGEFSVAKETYVKARTGWFSCRSACYLASGRPVVTQDTGWSAYLPTGAGLFAFEDLPGAAAALERAAAEPVRQGRAARRIAEEFFDSRRVLGDLLTRVGV